MINQIIIPNLSYKKAIIRELIQKYNIVDVDALVPEAAPPEIALLYINSMLIPEVISQLNDFVLTTMYTIHSLIVHPLIKTVAVRIRSKEGNFDPDYDIIGQNITRIKVEDISSIDYIKSLSDVVTNYLKSDSKSKEEENG